MGFVDLNLAPKENDVHRGYRFLSSFLLTAVFAAPLAMAAARPQDDKDRKEENRQGETTSATTTSTIRIITPGTAMKTARTSDTRPNATRRMPLLS